MERRSPPCRRVVEKIAYCRLCGSRRRQREEIGSTAAWRRVGTQSKRLSRRRSPLANRPAHPQTKVANLMKESHTKITTDTKTTCECLTFFTSGTLSET